MYRRDLREGQNAEVAIGNRNGGHSSLEAQEIGAAIVSAALATKTTAEFQSVVEYLRKNNPDVVRQLGW
jgi:hypothetical protein